MSTTFGIKIIHTGEIIPVARRVGIGNGEVDVFFINDLAQMLPNEINVVAMDNSAQGIKTIGDIKQAAWNKGVCGFCSNSNSVIIATDLNGNSFKENCPVCYNPPKLD